MEFRRDLLRTLPAPPRSAKSSTDELGEGKTEAPPRRVVLGRPPPAGAGSVAVPARDGGVAEDEAEAGSSETDDRTFNRTGAEGRFLESEEAVKLASDKFEMTWWSKGAAAPPGPGPSLADWRWWLPAPFDFRTDAEVDFIGVFPA